MKVSLIVAVAENGGIGKDNDLLWHLPLDMKHFKSTTSGHPVITGRKNYESIPPKFRPLPKRDNIVVTRRTDLEYDEHPNLHIVNSIDQALDTCKKLDHNGEIFVIGGGQIYRQFLDADLIDSMYITHVHAEFDADTFFPDVDTTVWKKKSEDFYPKSDGTEFAFSICKYEKIE